MEIRNEKWKRGETACIKEFHNVYTTVNIKQSDQMKKDKMGGTYRTYGRRNRHINVCSLECARSLSRSSVRLKDDIKADLRDMRWEDVDWIKAT